MVRVAELLPRKAYSTVYSTPWRHSLINLVVSLLALVKSNRYTHTVTLLTLRYLGLSRFRDDKGFEFEGRQFLNRY